MQGRTALTSASREWALFFLASWLILAAWALLFSALVVRRRGLTIEAGLYWAAMAHAALLLSVGLLSVLYHDDTAYHVFAMTAYSAVLRPLAVLSLLLPTVTLQVLILASRDRSSHLATLMILAIGTGAAVLRFSGLTWGLPGRFHPDEYTSKAIQMYALNDLNPHFFPNPSLMIYAIYFAQGAVRPYIESFHLLADLLGVYVNDPRSDFLLLLVGRVLSASAGVLSLGAVYLVGREIKDRRLGITAALLLGVSFLSVRNSHFATNDVTAGLILTLSLLFSARVATRGTFRDYALAALFGGLATSTKYTCAVFAIPLLAAHLHYVLRVRKAPLLAGAGRLLACVPISVAAFVALTPYSLLDTETFLRHSRSQAELGRLPALGQFEVPTWALILSTLAQGFGVVPLALAVIGSVSLGRGNLLMAIVVGSVPAAFVLSLSQQSYYYARFVAPALPSLAILAALGLIAVADRWSGRPKARLVYSILLSVALLQGTITSIQFNNLLNQTDTRIMAADWIEANAPPGSTVGVEVHSLMESPWGWGSNSTTLRESYWARDIGVFAADREGDIERILAGEWDYVIVTDWGLELARRDRDFPTEKLQTFGNLGHRLTLEATFRPGSNGGDVELAVDDMYSPFYHLFDRARPGPTVKIYSKR